MKRLETGWINRPWVDSIIKEFRSNGWLANRKRLELARYSCCLESVPFQKEVHFQALKGNALTGTLQTGPEQTDLVRSDALRRLPTATNRNKILTIALTGKETLRHLNLRQ